jgi:hypothetical protein
MTINATGLAISKKFDLFEAQLRSKLDEWSLTGDLDVLEFQRVGTVQQDPPSQLAATAYLRLFAQAAKAKTIHKLREAYAWNGMQHFAGKAVSLLLS